MVARVQVRTISNDEGNKLLRIVCRSSGSVVTWRRAQMMLLSAQGMDAVRVAEVTFTALIGFGTCCTTSTPTASTRWRRSTAVAGRRSSPSRSGRPSRRLH